MSAPEADITGGGEITYKKRGGWSRLAFANSATRREAKAILFVELAEATRRGMPLHEALETCMLTTAEIRKGSESPMDRGPIRIFQWLVTLAYIFMTAFGAVFILLLTSVWAADVERVARVLALRLLPLVRAGHSLSAAMAMLPSDYAPDEVSTIRAGEEWNSLPDALERLGQFQYYEREIQRHWARMVYPVWLGVVMLIIIEFTAIFIVPKFKDVYDQLGFPLPGLTEGLLAFGQISVVLGSSISFLALALGLFFFTMRLFMVGNRVLRDLQAVLLFMGIFFSIVGIATGFNENGNYNMDAITMSVVVILAGVLAVYGSRYLAILLEKFVLWLERNFSRAFGYIPIVGAPRQTELESRWLGGLSLGLASGVTAPQAVESAGDICGGQMARRSRAAADLISKGHAIGAAVLQSGVLRPAFANRLRLLDGRGDYTTGLAAIAEDAARESFHTMNRASRIAEVGSVCMIGLIAAALAFAMYLPLFNIPLVVGTLE